MEVEEKEADGEYYDYYCFSLSLDHRYRPRMLRLLLLLLLLLLFGWDLKNKHSTVKKRKATAAPDNLHYDSPHWDGTCRRVATVAVAVAVAAETMLLYYLYGEERSLSLQRHLKKQKLS